MNEYAKTILAFLADAGTWLTDDLQEALREAVRRLEDAD